MRKLLTGLLCLGLLTAPFLTRQSQATVNTTTSKVIYSGDGTTVTFPFSFNIFAASDLFIQVLDSDAVTYHTLVLNTDYTVSTTIFPGNGNVVLSGGGGYPVIAAGKTLIILRKLPFTQLLNISDNSATPASTWNQGYDRACMIEQQLQEQLSRSILQPVTQSNSIIFPVASANKVIGWNTAATSLINYDNPGQAVVDAQASAAAALASAVNASASVVNATAQAGNASASAIAAAASAASIPAVPFTIPNGGTGTTTGSITGTGALTFSAGGSNQNVILTPSGTGYTLLNGNVGIGTTNPAQNLTVTGTINATTAVQVNGNNVPAYADSRFKVIAVTKDISDNSGTQAITGAGFTPTAAIIFAFVNSSSKASFIGFDDLTTARGFGDYSSAGADKYAWEGATSIFIADTTNTQIGKFTSFSSDGGTITWTKSGSLTGTAYVIIMFFR